EHYSPGSNFTLPEFNTWSKSTTVGKSTIIFARIRHLVAHRRPFMSLSRLSWPYPRLIAHRGGGNKAPENTLAAFRKGLACGFLMMEYDVKLSADDVPILLHDDTLERTSSGTGPVAGYRYTDLARHDFGSWYSGEYAGEPVATLYSIAAYTRAHDIASNIEIKPSLGMETHTGERIAVLARELWSQA